MAGIIKAGQSTGGSASVGQAVAYHFGDVSEKAQAVLAAARTQAQEIVATAKREAEVIRSRAEQQGTQSAMTKAEQKKKQELEQQLKSVLPALQSAAESLTAARQNWIHTWEIEAVRLAARIAAKLVRRELKQDPNIPLVLIREALELAAGQRRVCIQLHPVDYELIAPQAAALAEQWNRLCITEIERCEEVTPGSCRLKTEQGQIDQRFDAQLARIEEELLQ